MARPVRLQTHRPTHPVDLRRVIAPLVARVRPPPTRSTTTPRCTSARDRSMRRRLAGDKPFEEPVTFDPVSV